MKGLLREAAVGMVIAGLAVCAAGCAPASETGGKTQEAGAAGQQEAGDTGSLRGPDGGIQGADGGASETQRAAAAGETLLPMQTENGVWGYVDLNGDMVIFPIYDEAGPFNSDGIAYVRIDNRTGYIDKSGKWALGPREMDEYFKFDRIETLSVNREAIEEAGLERIPAQPFEVCGNWGTVGMDGRVVIPFKYKSLNKCSQTDEKLFTAACDADGDGDWEYGLLDEKGEVRIPFEYDEISPIAACGNLKYEKDGYYGYLGTDGRITVEAQYDNATDFISGADCALVNNSVFCGLIDAQGSELVKMNYDYYSMPDYMYAYLYHTGDETPEWENGEEAIFYFYREDGVMQIYNATRKCFLLGEYDGEDSGVSAGNLLVVSRDGKFGAVDNQGEVVIDFIYDTFYGPDEDGLLLVCGSSQKWGMLNDKGETVIPLKYDDLWLFDKSGLAMAEKKGQIGCINREGETVIPFRYDDVSFYNEDELGAVLSGLIASAEGFSGEVGMAVGIKGAKAVFYNLQGSLLYEYTYPVDPDDPDMDREIYDMECAMGLMESLGFDEQLSEEKIKELFDPLQYDDSYEEEELEDYTMFYEDDGNYKSGIKDASGRILVKPAYDNIYYTEEEGVFLTSVYDEKEEKYLSGCISVENDKVSEIPAEYDNVYVEDGGIIVCEKNQTTKMMNRYGRWVLRLEAAEAAEAGAEESSMEGSSAEGNGVEEN